MADLDRREHREPARPPRHDIRRVKSTVAAATPEKLPLQAPSEGAAAAVGKADSKKEKESKAPSEGAAAAVGKADSRKEKESKVEAKAEQKQSSPPSASQVGPFL